MELRNRNKYIFSKYTKYNKFSRIAKIKSLSYNFSKRKKYPSIQVSNFILSHFLTFQLLCVSRRTHSKWTIVFHELRARSIFPLDIERPANTGRLIGQLVREKSTSLIEVGSCTIVESGTWLTTRETRTGNDTWWR